jgi:hypothetical protein
MSDEPKKRPRAWGWIGWAMIAILLLAYPLSMPPVMRWGFDRGELPRPVYKLYKPVMWVASLPVLKGMMSWYSSFWGVGWDPG